MFNFLSREPVHDPLASPTPIAETEVKTTTCYMCACRCGIRVHLRDGEVRYIDGNPNHPLNQGVICAKGSSGIMKQISPARLTQPLLRKPGSERGAGEFEPISWDRAFDILTERLQKIRSTDPKKFALFTGRDQMQALTGLFARQFGTPNYAAHGGFCSVNMAAGMIYTVGGSFWEFGGPDLDRAKLFVMIGTAEDHHSNPMKIALSKFKRAGGRFISINLDPHRLFGWQSWTIMDSRSSLNRRRILHGAAARTDRERPDRSCLPQALHQRAAAGGAGRLRPPGPLRLRSRARPTGRRARAPQQADLGQGRRRVLKPAYPEAHRGWLRSGTRGHLLRLGRWNELVAPSFQLLRERVASCTPEWAEAITGINAERIRKLAREMGDTALKQAFELPIPWTDAWGKKHPTTQARPVAFHAMRQRLRAISNGFQTVRAFAVLNERASAPSTRRA